MGKQHVMALNESWLPSASHIICGSARKLPFATSSNRYTTDASFRPEALLEPKTQDCYRKSGKSCTNTFGFLMGVIEVRNERRRFDLSTPTPPTDFQCWLDYAVATMDARGAYLDRLFGENDIRAAALEELNLLKQKSVMPWIGMLENWQTALSKRLGRSAEDIVENNLLATDFSGDSVRIQFEDGTDLMFRRAFYVGETPADGAVHRVAVFTEHCGYHEFWVGPDDRIEAVSFQEKNEHSPDLKGLDGMSLESSEHSRFVDDIRQAQSEIAQGLVSPYEFGPVSEQDLVWDNMAPMGSELGSPDYDRLMEEDAKKFASDLVRWIKQSSALYAGQHLEEDEVSDARNVQLALHELGQDVILDVAASVWKHYSQSIMAGWMAGAETVASAVRTLYVNCPRGQDT